MPNPVSKSRVQQWPKSVRLIIGTLLVGLSIVGVGFVVGLFTDFGRGTDPAFFAVVATIIPVFFLATYAQIISPIFPNRPATAVILMVEDVIIGEGLSLYAVGAKTSTTFLTIACAFAVLGQIVDLTTGSVEGARRAADQDTSRPGPAGGASGATETQGQEALG